MPWRETDPLREQRKFVTAWLGEAFTPCENDQDARESVTHVPGLKCYPCPRLHKGGLLRDRPRVLEFTGGRSHVIRNHPHPSPPLKGEGILVFAPGVGDGVYYGMALTRFSQAERSVWQSRTMFPATM